MSGELSFNLVDEALGQFANLAAEHHFIPVVMYTPAACAVYAPVRFADPALSDLLTEFSARQRSYFAAKAEELHMVFLDLTEPLRKAARPLQKGDSKALLYYPVSLHYTAHGHEVVAGQLADVLRQFLGETGAARYSSAGSGLLLEEPTPRSGRG